MQRPTFSRFRAGTPNDGVYGESVTRQTPGQRHGCHLYLLDLQITRSLCYQQIIQVKYFCMSTIRNDSGIGIANILPNSCRSYFPQQRSIVRVHLTSTPTCSERPQNWARVVNQAVGCDRKLWAQLEKTQNEHVRIRRCDKEITHFRLADYFRKLGEGKQRNPAGEYTCSSEMARSRDSIIVSNHLASISVDS